MKRLRRDLADQVRFATMLLEEAHLASQLSHPNVVSVLDFDRDPDGRPFLVMEYVDGVDLEALLAAGPVPHPVTIFIILELLAGLAYVHKAERHSRSGGLVHRDVTPRNVLLSWAGAVKLADFGVAQLVEGAFTGATVAFVGTSGYTSPEQASSSPLDGRSDLYAVGVLLWELLAHQRIPAGCLPRGIPRPSAFGQDVPHDLESIAMRLLAHDRRERYATADLAAGELVRCQDVPRDGRSTLVRLLGEQARQHPPRVSSACEIENARESREKVDCSLSPTK